MPSGSAAATLARGLVAVLVAAPTTVIVGAAHDARLGLQPMNNASSNLHLLPQPLVMINTSFLSFAGAQLKEHFAPDETYEHGAMLHAAVTDSSLALSYEDHVDASGSQSAAVDDCSAKNAIADDDVCSACFSCPPRMNH
jgi:hypothetical protein